MGEQPAGTEVIRERIRLHLAESTAAIDALVDVHELVGQVFGSTLETEHRGTAIWELAGHALALARAYLFLLEGGYVPADAVQARAVHEALLALEAVADPNNEEILKEYFADHGLKPDSARISAQRTQKRAKAAGAQIDADLRSLATKLHGSLSGFAHNRRRAVREAVSEPPIVFAYGPHPGLEIVASHVSYATSLVVHLVLVVAGSLGAFEGFDDTYRDVGEPLVARLEATDLAHPLGPESTKA